MGKSIAEEAQQKVSQTGAELQECEMARDAAELLAKQGEQKCKDLDAELKAVQEALRALQGNAASDKQEEIASPHSAKGSEEAGDIVPIVKYAVAVEISRKVHEEEAKSVA